ncbi:hypothetical protein ASPCADRAFT_129105 [Aspergillus carbonarius ITEM 5010]|uniref:A to I editase domain-containing protein n=1 Tax=Aspergillus carbonarius (strain ITEM 5010) TaxID=602072 RepID=A0A1R3RSH3_ASPC5|nr:hypothetical protein ASPCADRAFT_129105 [Aspergillus carbonarius ITEM 5010]
MTPSNQHQHQQQKKNSLGERIARLVHAHFDRLPTRSKPILRDDGTREWIPMCGVVVVRERLSKEKEEEEEEEELTCVAITSGAKCLPSSQLPNCTGLVLHDWHAEILALRAFNYWLLSEVKSVLTSSSSFASGSESKSTTSKFLRHTTTPKEAPNPPPFELHPSLKIYLYCTTAPCGDASMELTMAAQDDPTPWEIPPPSSTTLHPTHLQETPEEEEEEEEMQLTGRGHFSRLGIVRRKPARADAPSTLSKSCSDKLALRQVSSLISTELGLLVNVTPNAYLAGVVMPAREVSVVGCERAFGAMGRMGSLSLSLSLSQDMGGDGDGDRDGYQFRPFEILSVEDTIVEGLWKYAKPVSRVERCKPGTISAVWTVAPSGSAGGSGGSGGGGDGGGDGAKQLPKLYGSWTGLYETIINGMKQGFKASAPVGKGASALSRARMWGALRDLALLLSSSSSSLWGGCEGECGNEDGDGESEVEDWVQQVKEVVAAPSYAQFKRAVLATPTGRTRQRAISEAKKVLVPWVPNEGDDEWGLDVLTIDTKSKKRKR